MQAGRSLFLRLDFWFGKEYNDAVPQTHSGSGNLPLGLAAQPTPSTAPLDHRRGVLFRFWRWLTCGHGHHAWRLHAGVDLARHGACTHVIVARHCPRCDRTEVVE